MGYSISLPSWVITNQQTEQTRNDRKEGGERGHIQACALSHPLLCDRFESVRFVDSESSLNFDEYPSLFKYSEMDTSSSSPNTRTADTLKRARSNSIRHKPRSKMLPSERNVLLKLSEAHTTPSPPCETLSVELTSIDSTVRLCNPRNRLKLVYVTGLKIICERRAVRWLVPSRSQWQRR